MSRDVRRRGRSRGDQLHEVAADNSSSVREAMVHGRSQREAVLHLLSGGLSAGFVRATLQPLDTIKTRLQAARVGKLAGSGGRWRQSWQTIRSITLANGGTRGLYRGVVPGVLGIVPAAAVYMLVYQSLKKRAFRVLREKYHPAGVAASAAAGDIAASLVRVPCEMTKQRLQVGVYRNVGHALRELLHESAGNVGTMYRGLGAQLSRDVPFVMVEFLCYENLKSAVLNGRNPMSPASTSAMTLTQNESVLVGSICGAMAALVSNPMDVVKTRLMTQMPDAPRRYQGLIDCAMRIAQEEGPSTFLRGLAPRIVAKSMQSALFFVAYEALRNRLEKALQLHSFPSS
uniref:Mitochondrial carrier protein n=1 Tax=Compsopogon caeruleus TaxID=31354 RepID=A0A7S1XCF3_9RHOD|mmetsp:Transcript_16469/g.33606  ORF Transcript_16469/g.33606 Transcript_16469/m.33606 type:complete len:344 (+) Transcript_16469:1416-2447(+)